MKPVILVPWQNDFIPALGDLLVQREDFQQCTILFPHNRPRRYLKAYFKKSTELNGPVFLPRMTSIAEFVSGLRRDLTSVTVKPANRLDLIDILHQIVTEMHHSGRGQLGSLPGLDLESFLPWGMLLAGLMEDLFRQDTEPGDLHYMEGEVAEYASALLEQLNTIHTEYVRKLSELGWTTPDMDWRFVTTHLPEITDRLAEKPIIAAGFYALSGAEDLFFRALWENDILEPIIQSDPALAEGGYIHPAAEEHKAWMERWHTRPVMSGMTPSARKPDIRFCEGFDRHSQLAALENKLKDADNLADTAILLPDEGALIPVLHHQPDPEPNISMGYPLDRTSLAQLLEAVLTLQENRLEDGRYASRDVINLIRHPYLRLLGPDDSPLRPVFHAWEAEMRRGEQFSRPQDWVPPYSEKLLEEVDQQTVEPLRQQIVQCCLSNFEHIACLEDLADNLGNLAALLHETGERLWHAYLVDAECLFRLTSSVIPELKSATIKREPFSRSTLFSLLRQLLAKERVSFEPEPLAGLQIMGMLETRLLHFSHIHLLDAVEDRLPGTSPFDPLLPDPLRNLLGLPDARERDNVASYNFHRLIMGASSVTIYYSNSAQPGPLDSQSVRSRFVEQLLWEREQQEKRIIETGDPLVQAVTFPASPLSDGPDAITVTDAIRQILADKLSQRGLAPSALDRYMHCPKQFYFRDIARVYPMDALDDSGDRADFGTLIHSVLQEFFAPYKGQRTDFGRTDPTPLLRLFEDQLRTSELFARLPLESRLALLETGRQRLTSFIARQPMATIIDLEAEYNTFMPCDDMVVPLSGKLDRVEERDQGIVVLDYKTGSSLPLPPQKVWEDMELWERMHDFLEVADDPTLLADLDRAFSSVQVPLYMHLYSQTTSTVPHNGGLVDLAGKGETKFLCNAKWTDEERADIVDNLTPILVKSLIAHMIRTREFGPRPSGRCQWCDFKPLCGQ